MVGGGIANFTSVAATFTGIVKACTSLRSACSRQQIVGAVQMTAMGVVSD